MTFAYAISAHEAIRYHKGVPGFLEFQALMNQDVLTTFGPLLEPLGKGATLFLANTLEMARYATASEIKVRENERLIKLQRRKLSSSFDSEAAELNQYAVHASVRALDALSNIEIDERLVKVGSEKAMQTTFADARERFISALLEFNITNNPDFFEVVEIWEHAVKTFKKGGLAALRGHMQTQLREFAERRLTDERGTSPASPLPWWKYVLIAALIGAAIFAVVACFIWFGCSWAMSAVSAAAPWVFGIIDRGC